MTKPILSYFDFPGGRGEDCRIALHAAGIDFTDNRVNPKEWPQHKPSTPFGAMPVLDRGDGTKVWGSNPILSLVGRQHGLHPTDPWDAARHESVMDAIEDIRGHLFPTVKVPKEDREARRTEYANGPLQAAFANLEKQVQGPFLSGATLQVADLKVFIALRFLRSGNFDFIPTTVFDAYPKLVALLEAASAHDAVTSWYAK